MTASYSYTHVTDGDLLRNAAALAASGRSTTAELIAHLIEIERRKLHLAAAYPSLLDYCMRELKLSRDGALRRLRVARIVRRFPIVFPALADGRLTLSTVHQLRKYLRCGNGDELLKAAMNRTRSEVEGLIAERFPTSELLPLVDRIPVASPVVQVVPEPPATTAAPTIDSPAIVSRSAPVSTPAPSASIKVPRAAIKPTARDRVGFHCSLGLSTYEKFQHLQNLLSHAIPSGDVEAVLDRTFDLAIAELEKRKYGATKRPRSTSRAAKAGSRHIPAHVRRAVRERDGDRCTYVSPTGHRCTEHRFLEFDHIREFARGGEATVDNLRLRCRPHNPYAAERTYGAEFIQEKRAAARLGAGSRRPDPPCVGG